MTVQTKTRSDTTTADQIGVMVVLCDKDGQPIQRRIVSLLKFLTDF